MDWHDWHAAYDDPSSALNQRLRAVQGQIRAGLDRSPAGPVKVISTAGLSRLEVVTGDAALTGHYRDLDPAPAATRPGAAGLRLVRGARVRAAGGLGPGRRLRRRGAPIHRCP
jgi:hypothetical protein